MGNRGMKDQPGIYSFLFNIDMKAPDLRFSIINMLRIHCCPRPNGGAIKILPQCLGGVSIWKGENTFNLNPRNMELLFIQQDFLSGWWYLSTTPEGANP